MGSRHSGKYCILSTDITGAVFECGILLLVYFSFVEVEQVGRLDDERGFCRVIGY